MTSNSADLGGVYCATGYSTVTATDCTMTSNSAQWGGVYYINDNSTVTATDCTMTSNSAHWGGIYYTFDDSTVIATDCTMTSNSAFSGGVYYTKGYSTVTATDCTMTSNSASWGGAVYAAGDSVVTATDCTMISNSAFHGGAVAVGENTSLAAATTTLAHCMLTSNSASSGGAALVVCKSGFADLVNSVFQSNGNDTEVGVGIVNLNGQVQCDVNLGCLPFCTVCREEEVPLLPPTQPPTGQVTPTPGTTSRTRETDGSAAFIFFVVVVALSILLMLAPAVISVRQSWHFNLTRKRQEPGGEGSERIELASLLQSSHVDREVDFGDAATEHSSGRLVEAPSVVHARARDQFVKSYEVSPAPVFVVDRNSMRITLWSPGCPRLVTTPLGCLLSELPFVNTTDGNRLHRALVRSFDGNDETRVFMLHLRAQGRHVLLEMLATHVCVAESEPIIVLTGRQVDPDLVGLMACASAVTPSEMDEKDGAVGELGGGTTTGDDEFDDSQLSAYIELIYDDKSSISSLTLPTLKLSSSSRSEAASDVIGRSRPSGSARDSADVSHTMPTGLSVHHCPADRRLTTPNDWDSDNSSARALSQIARSILTTNEMQARPALNALFEDIRTSRKWQRRTARQAVANRNALTKLCTVGHFLRIARECASFRVLFVEGPAVVPYLAISVAARRAIVGYLGRAPCW